MENVSGNSVGVDYHDRSLQVHVMDFKGDTCGEKRCRNEIYEVIKFVSRFGAVSSVAVEACTGSAEFGTQLKSATAWSVKLCHPGYVQRMRHNPDKSDKSDAHLIADLARVGYLPEVWLAPEAIRDLRTLVRYRKQLVDQRKQCKLRIRATLRQRRIKMIDGLRNVWSKRGLLWLSSITGLPEHTQWVFSKQLAEHKRLSESIAEVDVRIDAFVDGDALAKRLRMKKGIGSFSAAVLRAEIGTFTRFKNGKQLARFCGVSPRNCSSGERQADSGMIKAGNPLLKTVVVEAVHLIVQHDQQWNKFAVDLVRKGKPRCVVIGAVANRWLRKLYYEMLQFEQAQSGYLMAA